MEEYNFSRDEIITFADSLDITKRNGKSVYIAKINGTIVQTFSGKSSWSKKGPMKSAISNHLAAYRLKPARILGSESYKGSEIRKLLEKLGILTYEVL